MALSQIQCLDDNHVNWRTNESKPEFFYSEDQRLALEVLLRDGRAAFQDYVKSRSLREFLSELELERLSRGARVYKPGGERAEEERAPDDGAGSLQYWPERSDTSLPQLDIGWPDFTSYRGVTRVNVYAQPPLDGQTHIKEVVRKTIAQAQKVIAVAMDLFTDVDIFKDLLDAGFKRKVAVYIVLETLGLPHFMEMCQKAGMHRGHLKNLRVQTIAGTEFYTRSSTKVCGLMSQKFMFVDGDRAVSGSYSFTWVASRLDRNLITVLTGQAVETFDKLFRELYLNSTVVNLSTLSLQNEPEPEPLPQTAPAPLPSAAVARKLINPKYALVTSSAVETGSRESSDKNSAKNSNTNNPMVKAAQKPKELFEPPPVHPGLLNLERANMIAYLPTWPEPDPPSDVIGFINIRDSNKPMQAHLMRSELFETSQAIRFKEPFVAPEEPLPEKAVPRQKAGNQPPGPPLQPQVQNTQESGRQTNSNPKETDSDQRQNSEMAIKRDEAPPTPVPKRRTIQLVITNDVTKDTPDISMLKMTDSETDIPKETETSKKIPGPHKPSPTSVSETVKMSSEGGDKKDEKDEQKGVKIIEDNEKADSSDIPCSDLPRKVSLASTVSDEYFECGYPDNIDPAVQLTVNGIHTGSGRVEDHRHADGLNVMARFSQSMLNLRPENQEQVDQTEVANQQAPADIHMTMDSNQRQLHEAHKRKPNVVSSRTNFISTDRQGQPRVTPKVVIAKPGSFHRPTKAAGLVIGGHKYWQGKLFSQDKDAVGYIRLVPSTMRNDRTRPEQMGKSRTGYTFTHSTSSNRIPTTQGENRTPYGISISKLSQSKRLKGKIPGNALYKTTHFGPKGAI